VDNRLDIKDFKALVAIRSEEEYITNDESSWVLATEKADKRTDAYNQTYDSRPARPKGGDSLNLILE
jgi:hypothetical protein